MTFISVDHYSSSWCIVEKNQHLKNEVLQQIGITFSVLSFEEHNRPFSPKTNSKWCCFSCRKFVNVSLCLKNENVCVNTIFVHNIILVKPLQLELNSSKYHF